MISQHMFEAFADELVKTAKLSGKAKAALTAAGLGGLIIGATGEQAKDDLVAGRAMRKAQARSQGISPLLT